MSCSKILYTSIENIVINEIFFDIKLPMQHINKISYLYCQRTLILLNEPNVQICHSKELKAIYADQLRKFGSFEFCTTCIQCLFLTQSKRDFTHGSLSPLDYHVLTLCVNNKARYTCHEKGDVLYEIVPNLDNRNIWDKSIFSASSLKIFFYSSSL